MGRPRGVAAPLAYDRNRRQRAANSRGARGAPHDDLRVSDSGSKAGAAKRPHVWSGAVSVAARNALTSAYITRQASS